MAGEMAPHGCAHGSCLGQQAVAIESVCGFTQNMLNRQGSRFFPPVERAREDGLLMVGGKLTPQWLLDAYSHGIFPWPVFGQTLAWWSPDPRAIIEFDRFHVSRRLARTCRSNQF